MSREHAPRPGANWEVTVQQVETVVPDSVLGCRYCGVHAASHGSRYHHRVGLHDRQPMTFDQWRQVNGQSAPSGSSAEVTVAPPQPVPMNRANRRAEARAARRKR